MSSLRSFLFFFLLVLLSCSDKPETPAGVLPPEKMQQVLWDIIRADEYTNISLSRDSSANRINTRINQYRQIFELHGTTKEEMERSLDYYKARPELFKVVMDSIQKQSERQPKSFTDSARSARTDSAASC